MKPEDLEQKVESLTRGLVKLALQVRSLETENEALREALAELFRRSGKDPEPWLAEVRRRQAAALRRRFRGPTESDGP